MVRNLKRSPNLCDRQVLRSAVAGALRCLLKNQICPSLPSPVIPKVLPHTLHRARSSSHRQPDAPTFPMFSCIPNSSTAKVRQPQKRLCPVCNTHTHPSATSHASSLSFTPPHTHTHIVHPLLLGTVKEHTPGETVGRSADFKLSCQGSPFIKPDAKPKRQSKHKGQYTTA